MKRRIGHRPQPTRPGSGIGLNRREFLGLTASTLVGTMLPSCRSGNGCLKEKGGDPDLRVVAGYRGLAELPEFEIDCRGRLCCTADLPGVIDFHTHLGFSYYLAPPIDLLRATDRVLYLIDCDGASPPCTIDLDQYANRCATADMLAKLDKETGDAVTTNGSAFAQTHTLVNLLAEMDDTRVGKAVVLPIELYLDQNEHATTDALTAIAAGGAADRLIPFGSVHPHDPDWLTKLQGYQQQGVKGCKLHPTMQTIAPDDPATLQVLQECDRLQLPVLFHGGRAGIEPTFAQKYATGDHFVQPVSDFPDLPIVMGHAGALMDWESALELARTHDNVWLELSGPGIPEMQQILDTVGPERLLFGTDWPFYPEAYALSKVLIVTRHDATVRRMILGENAQRFLGI